MAQKTQSPPETLSSSSSLGGKETSEIDEEAIITDANVTGASVLDHQESSAKTNSKLMTGDRKLSSNQQDVTIEVMLSIDWAQGRDVWPDDPCEFEERGCDDTDANGGKS